MEYSVVHADEISRNPALEASLQEIDRRHPPVGYERLLYPWLLILPGEGKYVRFIRDEANRLVIPLMPVEQALHACLMEYGQSLGFQLLLVDTERDWLRSENLRRIPLGVLQNIDLKEFRLDGGRMRRLRYMVTRFAESGQPRTVEYVAGDRPPFAEMLQLLEAWGKSKRNVIWHTALCMEHLLTGALPPGHRAFLTYHNERLCSLIVLEVCEGGGYLMDQEFYDPEIAPMGHMEYAIVSMIEQLRKEGARIFSLGVTWYPFPFENHPGTDSEGWAWLKRANDQPTLLGRLFEQGRTNYQFKKKFGVEGEPLIAYLSKTAPFSTVLHYWSVFYQNSLTSPQLNERLRQLAPSSAPVPAPVPAPSSFDTPEDRRAAWDNAPKFEAIPYTGNPLDLMTDTWFGRDSSAVQVRLANLRARTNQDTPDALRQIFPFKHLILTPQGRDAEALFYSCFPKDRTKILTALPWTSTLMHQLQNGFEVVELPSPSALKPDSEDLFRGEIDLAALRDSLHREASKIALVGIEVLSNGTGGHPVRLAHIRRVGALLKPRGIPLVLDASRIVRNALLLQGHDSECLSVDVWDIVRETAAAADHVVTSLTKDFSVTTGGLIATNDDALAARIRETQAAQVCDPATFSPLIDAALADRPRILALIEAQMRVTESLQHRLGGCGIQILAPALGHAIVIDCAFCLKDASSKTARLDLLRDLFIETGIRAGLHQAGQQRNGPLGRSIRLAFPLGTTQAAEDRIFQGLKSFFERRASARTAPTPPAPLVTDFSPWLTDSEAALLAEAPPATMEMAIVGLSGRYPQAGDHFEFWEGLRAGKNFVQPVPPSRWDHPRHHEPSLGKTFSPGKTRCQFGSFLNAHDQFDAAFFRIAPENVAVMDPQERLAMEVVWECVEDAGYVPSQLSRETGLFAGVTYNEFQKLVPRTSHSCFLTSRLAYFLDFHGPAMALDTGCASSMTALDSACQSIRSGGCPAAIVVGSNLLLHPDHYATLSPELSTTAQPFSTPFGQSDGWIPAEGVVAILLKPLAEAVRNRDHIYAVVKSSLVGQEGKTSWFNAPNPRRQASLFASNFEKAGIHPSTISYVEAAANGSPLGDAIEMEGLTAAFGKGPSGGGCCPIGSVKSSVGHAESVSTLLQLTKVLLQFKTREIYPLLHREKLNPNIRFAETPFRLPDSVESWERPVFQLRGQSFSVPRRATIFSFGGGGNIGHLIIEEAPTPSPTSDAPASCLIPLSAASDEQLRQSVQALVSFLDRLGSIDAEWEKNYRLWNIMRTLCEGRVAFPCRAAFVATDRTSLQQLCRRFLANESDPGIITRGVAPANGPDFAALFSSRHWQELGRCWTRGADVPWAELFAPTQASRVPLPSYRFARRRFAISSEAFLQTSSLQPSGNSAPALAPPVSSVSDQGSVQKLIPWNAAGILATGEARVTSIFKESVRNEQRSATSKEQGSSQKLFLDRPQGDSLDAVVLAAFSKVLSVPGIALDPSTPLDQYGFDSAMVVGVAAELEKRFPQVPPTLFFECATIREVADYLRAAFPQAAGDISASGEPDLEHLAEEILSDHLTIDQVLEQLA